MDILTAKTVKKNMTTFQMSLLGGGEALGPQMNKFEHVFSNHHQMSLLGIAGGRSLGLMSGRGAPYCPTKPSDLSHDAFNVTYPPQTILSESFVTKYFKK